MKKKGSPAVLPSPGSLSLPRRTRAFLAPRPFSAVAATTAAMFRSHPPSPRSPPGIVVCVRGLPRSFRLSYRSETTFPRSLRSGPRRTTLPRRPRRRARSLVSLLLGAESGRAEFGFPRPRPGLFSQLCPVIGGSASPPPSLLVERPSLSLPGGRLLLLPPGRRGSSSASSRRADSGRRLGPEKWIRRLRRMESESESGAAADTPPLETLSFHGDEEIIEVVELDPGPPDPGESC